MDEEKKKDNSYFQLFISGNVFTGKLLEVWRYFLFIAKRFINKSTTISMIFDGSKVSNSI